MTTAEGPATCAAANPALLAQYLLHCPRCGQHGAAHIDESITGSPKVVRFVCPAECDVDERAVLRVLADEATARQRMSA